MSGATGKTEAAGKTEATGEAEATGETGITSCTATVATRCTGGGTSTGVSARVMDGMTASPARVVEITTSVQLRTEIRRMKHL